MDRIQELIRVLSDEEVVLRSRYAKGNRTCKICGGTARSFRTPFSRLEYDISAICQDCQDYYFLDDDDRCHVA